MFHPLLPSFRLVPFVPCLHLPGEHAYKCSWCSFSTMTISQLKEHSLKVHGKALTLPRPRIVSLLSSHSHHSSQKATPAEEVEDSNGKMGCPAKINHLGLRWAGINCQLFFLEENLLQKHGGSSEGRNMKRLNSIEIGVGWCCKLWGGGGV